MEGRDVGFLRELAWSPKEELKNKNLSPVAFKIEHPVDKILSLREII